MSIFVRMLRYAFFLVFILGQVLTAQGQLDTANVVIDQKAPVGAVGLEVSDIGLLTSDLLSAAETGAYFDYMDGWRPGVVLMRMDSSWVSLLALRVLFERRLMQIEVPLVDAELTPLGGETTDRHQRASLVLDVEVGKQRIWYHDKWHFIAGPSLFVSYGRYEEQFETDNPLEAYIGETFNLTSRSRMMSGIRARAAIGRQIGSQWAVDLSATYQAGLRFSPEVTALVASQGDLTTVGLSRRIVSKSSTESFAAEAIVPSIRLVYLIR